MLSDHKVYELSLITSSEECSLNAIENDLNLCGEPLSMPRFF